MKKKNKYDNEKGTDNINTVRTPVIPVEPVYVGTEDELDYKAICFFAATNFFFEDDTYFKGKKCLQPGREYTIENNKVVSEKRWFEWEYSPREITLSETVDEFAELFEKVTREQLGDKRVILPLSGGLDSRTQAAVLAGRDNVYAYSYEYPRGVNETGIAAKVAKVAGFEFEKFLIPKGYLWDNIEHIGRLLDYGADVTSPRQASMLHRLSGKGDMLYLGHWGDVLFDDMGVNDIFGTDEMVAHLKKKIVKKGGLVFADALWKEWGLPGDFETELNGRLTEMLDKIKIDNANAKIRAFKSLYWAPRWTSVSLAVFAEHFPLAIPYYDDRMCKFITTVPESHLAGRKIQIEYIKKVMPEMASVIWQPYSPYDLYDYHRTGSVVHLFRRAYKKLFRIITNKKIIQRNWEMQYLGEENDERLRAWLFENSKFRNLVSESFTRKFYNNFIEGDMVMNVHPVSTLLTLSLFAKEKL